MGFDKKPVNLSLSADLVRRVRAITPNLSETVERLLTQFLAEKQAEEGLRRQDIADAIATRFYQQRGVITVYSPED